MNLKKSIDRKRHAVLKNFSKLFDVEVICEDHIDNDKFDVYLSLGDLYKKEFWVLHVNKSLTNARGTCIKDRSKTVYSFESIKKLPEEVECFRNQNKQVLYYDELVEVDKYKFSGDESKLGSAGFIHIPSIREGYWIYRFKINNHGRFSAYFTLEIDVNKDDRSLKWDCCDIDGFGQWITSLTQNEIDKINEKLKEIKEAGVIINV